MIHASGWFAAGVFAGVTVGLTAVAIYNVTTPPCVYDHAQSELLTRQLAACTQTLKENPPCATPMEWYIPRDRKLRTEVAKW